MAKFLTGMDTKTGYKVSGSEVVDASGKIDYGLLKNLPASFPPATHNHDGTYLKLTGGTIDGALAITGNLSVQGTQIGFGDDVNAIVLNDAGNENRAGHYAASDSFTFKLDNSLATTVIKTGHVDVQTVYTENKVGVNKFSMEYNPTEGSLDILYIP